jgi:hypothetical protein
MVVVDVKQHVRNLLHGTKGLAAHRYVNNLFNVKPIGLSTNGEVLNANDRLNALVCERANGSIRPNYGWIESGRIN